MPERLRALHALRGRLVTAVLGPLLAGALSPNGAAAQERPSDEDLEARYGVHLESHECLQGSADAGEVGGGFERYFRTELGCRGGVWFASVRWVGPEHVKRWVWAFDRGRAATKMAGTEITPLTYLPPLVDSGTDRPSGEGGGGEPTGATSPPAEAGSATAEGKPRSPEGEGGSGPEPGAGGTPTPVEPEPALHELLGRSPIDPVPEDSVGRAIRASDCAALIRYRDGRLVQEWKRATSGFSVSSQLVGDLERFREELREDTWYGRSPIPIIARVTKTTTDLIEDLYGLVTGRGLLYRQLRKAASASGRQLTAATVYAALKDERVEKLDALHTLVTTESAATAAHAGLEAAGVTGGGGLGGAVGAFWSLAENMTRLTREVEDQQELVDMVDRRLADLAAAIAEYNSTIRWSEEHMRSLHAVQMGIDRYCGLTGGHEPTGM